MIYTEELDVVFNTFDIEEAKRAKAVALKDMQTKRPKDGAKNKSSNRKSS